MEKQQKSPSAWQLVHVNDLPIPSQEELQAARRRWVEKQVWFFVGSDRWWRGMVYSITKRGEVKIAVWRGGAWVHDRVIRLEYVPRVLRLASGAK
jgi:hypothetical protein